MDKPGNSKVVVSDEEIQWMSDSSYEDIEVSSSDDEESVCSESSHEDIQVFSSDDEVSVPRASVVPATVFESAMQSGLKQSDSEHEEEAAEQTVYNWSQRQPSNCDVSFTDGAVCVKSDFGDKCQRFPEEEESVEQQREVCGGGESLRYPVKVEPAANFPDVYGGDECQRSTEKEEPVEQQQEVYGGGESLRYPVKVETEVNLPDVYGDFIYDASGSEVYIKTEPEASAHKNLSSANSNSEDEIYKCVIPHKCSVCGKGFSCDSHLQIHMRIHTGEQPYNCELCGRRFAQKSTLLRHQRIHNGEKSYKCEVCGKRFAEKSNMFQHQKIHNGEKRHKCEVCGRGFAQKSNLFQHQRIHNGKKPYQCEVCGRGFAWVNSLAMHKRTHIRYK